MPCITPEPSATCVAGDIINPAVQAREISRATHAFRAAFISGGHSMTSVAVVGRILSYKRALDVISNGVRSLHHRYICHSRPNP
jgi:hypothetical protein